MGKLLKARSKLATSPSPSSYFAALSRYYERNLGRDRPSVDDDAIAVPVQVDVELGNVVDSAFSHSLSPASSATFQNVRSVQRDGLAARSIQRDRLAHCTMLVVTATEQPSSAVDANVGGREGSVQADSCRRRDGGERTEDVVSNSSRLSPDHSRTPLILHI